MKNQFSLFTLLLFFLFSCGDDDSTDPGDLNSLPIDEGGINEAKVLGSTSAVYGHYVYTPSGYNQNSADYPLLVFLHGSGEKGNSDTNPDDLKKVLVHGPLKLIETEMWSPTFPMIVVAPQLPTGENWNADNVHDFIQYLIDNYNINESRIYLTGLSLGAIGSFAYIAKYGSDSFVAAVVPIAGQGNTSKGDQYVDIPIWAFHGDNDNTVRTAGSINMVEAINEANPTTRAKLTIYPGVGHNSWTRTYDGSGMGDESTDYDAFNMSIYDWMFTFQKE
ncbi:carboxylesterase family protein [Ekhidna sp.]